jgi:hypothetical protein
MATTEKKGKKRDVRVTEPFKKKVRVEIEPEIADEKRKQLAKLLTKRRKTKEKMQPFKDEIAEMTADIDTLERDVDENTEEREHLVFQEFDYKRNEVRTFLHPQRELAEKRTMTKEDLQYDLTQQEKDAEETEVDPDDE